MFVCFVLQKNNSCTGVKATVDVTPVMLGLQEVFKEHVPKSRMLQQFFLFTSPNVGDRLTPLIPCLKPHLPHGPFYCRLDLSQFHFIFTFILHNLHC
jgi:hypothetical protein